MRGATLRVTGNEKFSRNSFDLLIHFTANFVFNCYLNISFVLFLLQILLSGKHKKEK